MGVILTRRASLQGCVASITSLRKETLNKRSGTRYDGHPHAERRPARKGPIRCTADEPLKLATEASARRTSPDQGYDGIRNAVSTRLVTDAGFARPESRCIVPDDYRKPSSIPQRNALARGARDPQTCAETPDPISASGAKRRGFTNAWLFRDRALFQTNCRGAERAIINVAERKPRMEVQERRMVERRSRSSLWIDPATAVWFPTSKKGKSSGRRPSRPQASKRIVDGRSPRRREIALTTCVSVVTYAGTRWPTPWAFGDRPRSGEIIEADIIWWHTRDGILHAGSASDRRVDRSAATRCRRR